jgi:hypothetical protein
LITPFGSPGIGVRSSTALSFPAVNRMLQSIV